MVMSNYGLSLGTGVEVSGFDLGSAALHLSLEKNGFAYISTLHYSLLQQTSCTVVVSRLASTFCIIFSSAAVSSTSCC